MKRRYKAIVTGPKEYLPGEVLIEEFVITQEDINEYLGEDDSETEEDAINYYKEEYIAVWAQRWCNAVLFTENELPLFDDDDGEEEEQEEDEWEDWQ
jgi:hypothetical protein